MESYDMHMHDALHIQLPGTADTVQLWEPTRKQDRTA